MRGLFLGLVALLVSLSLFSAPLQTGAVNDGFRVISDDEKETVVEFVLPEYSITKLNTGK